jgi:hypothetical protein
MCAGEGPYRPFRSDGNAVKNNNKKRSFVFTLVFWGYPRGRSGGMHEFCDIFLNFVQRTWWGWSKESGCRYEGNIKI